MKLIKIKRHYTYAIIIFTSIFMSSCSALKTCDCPGLGFENIEAFQKIEKAS